MKKHGIIVAIVIFALIIAGMFIFAFLKKSELAVIETENQTPTAPLPTPYDYITRVDAKHFFIDGTHTIAGEMLMPTQCDLLNWTTAVSESNPQEVTVAFVVVNNARDCEPAVTPARFLVPFTAGGDAHISATLNGRSVELNLIPAGANEKPVDFELFLKG